MEKRRQRTAHATYLAMRIAVLLDAFGLACSDLISSYAGAESAPGEEFPNWDIRIPELPPYPEDTEGWVSLDRALGSRCLRLHSKIRARQRVINETRDDAEDQLGETVGEEAAAMGLEAWQLAIDLHRKYGLALDGDDYAPFLKETAANIIAARNARSSTAARPPMMPRP
jgi:hypothetical protein